jgi:cell division protein FtsL
MFSITKMLEQNEKVYLIVIVTSAIILIFMALYFTNNCLDCDETYYRKDDRPIVVYRIG